MMAAQKRKGLLFANDRFGHYPDSFYAATANLLPEQPVLQGYETCDVCIVGAGYTGLSAALHLARRGFTVRVLEAHRIGWGASGRNGGQLGSGQRLEQHELEDLVGVTRARALWDLSEESKALVKGLIAEEKIDCAYKPGVLHADHKASYSRFSRDYVEKLERDYGYQHLTFLNRDAVAEQLGAQGYFSGVLDRDAGHLNPLKFCLGLGRAALKAGAVVHERSPVLDWSSVSLPGGEQGYRIKTPEGSVSARHLVLACNGYLERLNRAVARRIMPINNFIVATEPLGEAVARSLIRDDVAVADSRFVINYYRLSEDRRLLFGGGENYRYRFPSDIRSFVKKPLLEVYPQLEGTRLDFGWGGTLGITRNRMPVFMKPERNLWTACGFSGHGLGMATLSGKLLAEAIDGTESRFDLMASVPSPVFPGGALLRWPLLVLAMSWFALRDRL